MRVKLLKRVRKRYKIVHSVAKHGHTDLYYNAIDTKSKWKSEDCLTLNDVEKILIDKITNDYPDSIERNRVVDVWF